jgi:hypothetical protein
VGIPWNRHHEPNVATLTQNRMNAAASPPASPQIDLRLTARS